MLFRVVQSVVIVVSSLLLFACRASEKPSSTTYTSMSMQIARCYRYSKASLQPYFAKAKVPYPSKKLGFLVFKKTKQLQLYASYQSRWHYIRSYPIHAASGKMGPKLKEGDGQVPEGVYRITALNPDSRFDLSMHISYPNDFDRFHARLDGRKSLGGNIFIHGGDSSEGCVALGDGAIEQLFPLVYSVGVNNTVVVIAPFDLRRHKPIIAKSAPKWLPVLYGKISKSLRYFPVHKSHA